MMRPHLEASQCSFRSAGFNVRPQWLPDCANAPDLRFDIFLFTTGTSDIASRMQIENSVGAAQLCRSHKYLFHITCQSIALASEAFFRLSFGCISTHMAFGTQLSEPHTF